MVIGITCIAVSVRSARIALPLDVKVVATNYSQVRAVLGLQQ